MPRKSSPSTAFAHAGPPTGSLLVPTLHGVVRPAGAEDNPPRRGGLLRLVPALRVGTTHRTLPRPPPSHPDGPRRDGLCSSLRSAWGRYNRTLLRPPPSRPDGPPSGWTVLDAPASLSSTSALRETLLDARPRSPNLPRPALLPIRQAVSPAKALDARQLARYCMGCHRATAVSMARGPKPFALEPAGGFVGGAVQHGELEADAPCCAPGRRTG
jgi:hypothetical protein